MKKAPNRPDKKQETIHVTDRINIHGKTHFKIICACNKKLKLYAWSGKKKCECGIMLNYHPSYFIAADHNGEYVNVELSPWVK
jgi:hypothetical protein